MAGARLGNRFAGGEEQTTVMCTGTARVGSFAERPLAGRNRQGFALAAALLALMLIAVLVPGVFFAATDETRIGAASAERQFALSAAESAIETTIAGWAATGPGPISIGETRVTGVAWSGTPVQVYVTRLDSALYWIVAEAGTVSSTSGVTRRIGVVVGAQSAPGGSITIDRISERWWSELF
jgi:Tfp pilus assembly protein PilX